MIVESPEKRNTFIIEESLSLADKEFVADLIANKEDAWERFIDFSSKIIARHKQHLHDLGFSISDLVNETYLYLTQNNHQRLREFLKSGKSFIGFVFNSFKAAKSRLLYYPAKNRQNEVSDSGLYFPHLDNNADFKNDQSYFQDYREVLKQAFFLLWESNSQRAYVYFLRRKLELPSKEIAELFGITTNNVDVVLKRAEGELKDILEEMGIKNDILRNE